MEYQDICNAELLFFSPQTPALDNRHGFNVAAKKITAGSSSASGAERSGGQDCI